MRIWTVVVGEPSPVDGPNIRRLRTGLLTRYLRARGHDVTWFNGTVDHANKIQRFDHNTIQPDGDGTTMIFLHGRLYHGHVTPTRIKNHRETAASFTEIAAKLPPPDIIACSYPTIEMAAAVAAYAAPRKIPFVLDLRDLWPDMIADVAPKGLRWAARLMLSSWFTSARRSMQQATALVAFAQPYLDWGLAKAGRGRAENDRVFHLAADPETVDDDALEAAGAEWDKLGVTEDTINIVFAGMLSARHDFESVIEGFRKLDPLTRQSFRIVICGKGEAEARLRERAQGMPEIVFPGWRNLADIQALFRRAEIGLLPYRNTRDFEMSYPNKVGEYLGAGLPILTSLGGEVGKLLALRQCGVTYREGDAQSFANVLAAIIDERLDLPELSSNARNVYHDMFDADRIYNDYADYLESLAG